MAAAAQRQQRMSSASPSEVAARDAEFLELLVLQAAECYMYQLILEMMLHHV